MIEERRFIQATIRSADAVGTKARILQGLAVRYGALSEDLGNWRERIAPAAFRASLADGHDVKMLFGHDPNRILGSTHAGSLRLSDTSEGLQFRCEMPRTSDGDDTLELCRSNLLREMSFGFRCLDDNWQDEDDPDDDSNRTRGRGRKIPVRTVRTAHLLEISPVAWPAYGNDATSIRPEMAAAAARNLFPAGIPMEIRSRIPGLAMTDAERAIYTQALVLETKGSLR